MPKEVFEKLRAECQRKSRSNKVEAATLWLERAKEHLARAQTEEKALKAPRAMKAMKASTPAMKATKKTAKKAM